MPTTARRFLTMRPTPGRCRSAISIACFVPVRWVGCFTSGVTDACSGIAIIVLATTGSIPMASIWSETTRIDLRVAEVPNPRPGNRIEIDGEAFLIQGEPIRDRERLVWTVDLRPA